MMKKINLIKKFDAFATNVCNRFVYSYQRPFIFRLIKSVFGDLGAEITVLFARQCGKTEALCMAIAFIVIWVNLLKPVIPWFRSRFEDGIWIGTFAPKGEQAQIDLKRIRKFLPNSFLSKFKLLVTSDSATRLEAVRETRDGQQVWFHIEAISASETSNIESKTFHIIVIEEAQDVTEHKITEEILPMGAATNASVILIGTVGNMRWYFYDAIQRNKNKFPENHFEVDYREPIRENFRNGAYKKFVDAMVRKHGYESEVLKKKFRNIWTLEIGQLFTHEAFWKCAKKEVDWLENCFELPPNVFLAAGLDVAKDPDETVLTIGTVDFQHGVFVDEDQAGYEPLKMIRYWQVFSGVNFNVQKVEIKNTLRRFPLLRQSGCIAVDATGDRGSFAEWFEELGYNVLPVVFSSGVKTGKGELTVKFVDALNAGHLFFAATEEIVGTSDFYNNNIPPDIEIKQPKIEFTKFKNQCFDCEKERKGERLDLHAPKGVGRLDDFIDSAMLFVKAAGEVNDMDFNDLKLIGDEIKTASLMREIQRIDFNQW